MAAIFIQNIPATISELALTQSLASVLHAPPFHNRADTPVNFSLHLHRDRHNRSRFTGNGSLIISNAQIGQLFLQLYGGFGRAALPCERNSPRMTFRRDQKPPPPEVVASLQKTPYADPVALRERHELAIQLSKEPSITNVQFGWWCRDDVFSIEWDAQADHQIHESACIRLDEESREIRISLGAKQATPSGDGMAMFQRPPPEHWVVSRFSNIESIASNPPGPSVVITFHSPPSFEQKMGSAPISSIFGRSEQPPPRTRLPALPGTHSDFVRYTSLAMRVICSSTTDLRQLQQMIKAANLPQFAGSLPAPERRALFSATYMRRIEELLGQLDWVVAFKVRVIATKLLLDGKELAEILRHIVTTSKKGNVARACEVLQLFESRLEKLYWNGTNEEGGTSIKACLDGADGDVTAGYMRMREERMRSGTVDCRHIIVTPSRAIMDGPYADQGNRVLRTYPHHQDHFLRVQFLDEEKLSLRHNGEVDGPDFVRRRVGGVLKKGLVIDGRDFQLLAYSQSALKEHSFWFVASFTDETTGRLVTAESIRNELGDFTKLERYPAKYAARLSQAFSATLPSVRLNPSEVKVLPDIISPNTGSIFTDGVGQISKELADKIAISLETKPGNKRRFFVRPSAYQFRMGGAKGVLMVDPTLSGTQVVLRESQVKFESSALDMEIAMPIFEPRPMYLNRFMIMILETLGVPASAFLAIQDQAVQLVKDATRTMTGCVEFLRGSDCGKSFRLEWIFMNLSRIGVELHSAEVRSDYILESAFIDRSIEFAVAHVMRDIKHKARIPVPGSFTLVGVADFQGFLKPDEVFVCIHEEDCEPRYLEGDLIVTRSPQVHTGDVQAVRAIGRPPAGSPFELEEYPNCIVFSTRGTRSTPSKLGGGDLDGDEYNITCNKNLFPPKCDTPASYPPAKLYEVTPPCTIHHVADWIVNYINSDLLGVVSDQLLLMADRSPEMCRDKACKILAELHSKAVDFAKSGTPVQWAEMPKNHSKEKPDWWVGESGTRHGIVTYVSGTALGKLFRAIDITQTQRQAVEEAKAQKPSKNDADRQVGIAELIRRMNGLSVNETLEHPISRALRRDLEAAIDLDSVPESTLLDVHDLFRVCATEVQYLAASCSLRKQPLTEEEVMVGVILARTTQPRRRKDSEDRLREGTADLCRRIRRELAMDDIVASAGKLSNHPKWLAKAWAAWRMSLLREKEVGARIFGLLALGSIFDCVKAIKNTVR